MLVSKQHSPCNGTYLVTYDSIAYACIQAMAILRICTSYVNMLSTMLIVSLHMHSYYATEMYTPASRAHTHTHAHTHLHIHI